jgi:serine/threonine protein kinase
MGYLEEFDNKHERVRYALVYGLQSQEAFGSEAANNRKEVRSLLQLLRDYRKVLFPPLETRFELARILCRAMLLYHASDWIHHDFRSHNIVFMPFSPLARPDKATRAASEYRNCQMDQPYISGFGLAREEADISLTFDDPKTISDTLKQQRLYWSPAYLASSEEKRTARNFQRSHDIYSLGCVLLEIGVWQPLESYSWKSEYETSHVQWHRRLLQEEGKLRALCGSRYAEVVMQCLNWGTSDIQTDVQMLCFDVLQQLEELTV